MENKFPSGVTTEYTVLTCMYRISHNLYTEPGQGPFSQKVTELLSKDWRFRGELRVIPHIEFEKGERKVFIILVQEFYRKRKEEEERGER